MPADGISTGVALLVQALSWGATYFIHSTCLIAGIWLFVRRRRTVGHALRETLWKTALVGGVVTASLQMWLAPIRPFGVLTLTLEGFGSATARSTVQSAAIDSSSINGFAGLHSPAWIRHRDDDESGLGDELSPGHFIPDARITTFDSQVAIADNPAAPDGANLAVGQSAVGHGSQSPWRQLYGAVVGSQSAIYVLTMVCAMLAIVLGIVRCGWQTISLRRKLARCRLIHGGPARELLNELLRLVPRAPAVQLLSAPDDSEPAAFGVARWTIVLPPRATFDLTEDELRALLAHELAHLVRGDSLWLYISRAVCSCLAFQPLNHLARREWQRTAEFLCDNWAVSRTGAPLALARCLTEVASWRLAGPASAAILAATGRKSGLIDRIERLLDARPVFEPGIDLRVQRRTVFAGAVVLATLACCAPRVQLVAAAPRENDESVQNSLRLAEFDARLGEADSGDPDTTDAAKPQASGERHESVDVLRENADQGASSNTEQRPAGDIASLLKAIDGDLVALADELEQLGPLLADNADPPVVALAKRLRDEVVRLQHRREVLKALSRMSVNRF